ncbi:MAG: prolipoprotein diacylglyceryl transferase [Planctomycetes bacterium]|nr:prolipoprotein diacylglyceryl transferase [Planctomycetota bacterium]
MFPILAGDYGSLFSIKSYGVMVALGFLAALGVGRARARAVGIPPEIVSDVGTWVVVAGLLGARLLYVVAFWDQFRDRPVSILWIWEGGLVLYGGILAGTAAGIVVVMRRHLPLWRFADAVAPGTLLGIALGRIGCFLNGCCWGPVCDEGAWYAVRFPTHSLAYREMAARGILSGAESGTPPLFPAQLAYAAADLVLFGTLLCLSRWKRYEGQVFCWFVGGYAILRFGLERFRADVVRHAWGPTSGTLAQWISLAVLVAITLLSVWLRRRCDRRDEEGMI